MSALTRVVIEAPAKINLFLDITGRRDNGYHLLDTVMQAVSLSDLLVVSRCGRPGIRITCTSQEIPEDGTNLAHRAAAAFLDAAVLHPKDGLHIHIDKRIPSQAGLGGGSTDAAAVLTALNRLYDSPLEAHSLQEMALSLGADVPFFLSGGCARAQGVGELLSPLPTLPDCCIVIAKPGDGVCTADAYREYDSLTGVAHPAGVEIRNALSRGDLVTVAATLSNVFEQVRAGEAIPQIKQQMHESGSIGAVMSGSGNAVAGLFASGRQAEACIAKLRGTVPHRYMAHPLPHGVIILHES